MKKRLLPALLVALVVAACGEGEPADEPASAAGVPAEEVASSAPAPGADPASADAPAAAPTAETEEEATGGEMASYEECMAQARDLEAGSQARTAIERACGNLPDAPR